MFLAHRGVQMVPKEDIGGMRSGDLGGHSTGQLFFNFILRDLNTIRHKSDVAATCIKNAL